MVLRNAVPFIAAKSRGFASRMEPNGCLGEFSELFAWDCDQVVQNRFRISLITNLSARIVAPTSCLETGRPKLEACVI